MINKDGSANLRGFTLFELLVVLVIMGLVSSLVVITLAGTMSHMHTQTAAKKVASSLRFARSQAVTGQTPYMAVIDFENRRLSILSKARHAERESAGAENVAGSSGNPREYVLPETVAFSRLEHGDIFHTDGVRELFFYPNGSSSGGRLWIEGERERQYAVEIEFVTGAAKIKGETER